MRGAPLIAVAVLVVSCSGRSPRPSVTADVSAGARRRAIPIAVIRGRAPEEPFIDLGPILLGHIESDEELHERLQIEADRLRADGFILEGRGLELAHVAPAPAAPALIPFYAIVLIADVVRGDSPVLDPERGVRVHVRAYRLGRGPTPRAVLSGLPGEAIAPILRERIEGFDSLEEQLEFVNELFVRGELDARAFTAVRAALCST